MMMMMFRTMITVTMTIMTMTTMMMTMMANIKMMMIVMTMMMMMKNQSVNSSPDHSLGILFSNFLSPSFPQSIIPTLSKSLRRCNVLMLAQSLFFTCNKHGGWIHTAVAEYICLSVDVRKLLFEILARSSREMSQTVRID